MTRSLPFPECFKTPASKKKSVSAHVERSFENKIGVAGIAYQRGKA